MYALRRRVALRAALVAVLDRPMNSGARPNLFRFGCALLAFACLSLLSPRAGLRAAEQAGMVRVPGGPFIMGSDRGPGDERPAHRVGLAPFWIDRTPVTNRQFALFLNAVGPIGPAGERFYDQDDSDARILRAASGWRSIPGFEAHPVVEVSWFGARAYCAWAGKRLPTEAEWEKAARGTDGRQYPWGNQPPDPTLTRFGAGWNQTVPVGGFPRGASPYGALEMAGNVWQWVSSAYRPYPYDSADGRESDAPGPIRVTRGGAHDSPAADLTVTNRGRNVSRNPRSGHHNVGFRCARSG
jgi:formylglycine-generating enzyme required for sulfatase activity